MSDVVVSWGSSDPSVVIASTSGLITAVGNGQAFIYASAAGLSATVLATVEQMAVGILVTPNPVTTSSIGSPTVVLAFVVDRLNVALSSQPAIQWAVGDRRVALIDQSGTLLPISHGQTQVVASTQTGLTGVAAVQVLPLDAPLSALRLDGNDDIATVPDGPSLNPTQEMTLEFWVRFARVGPGQWCVLKDNGSDRRQYGMGIVADSHRMRAHIATNSGYHSFDGSTELQAGEWIHVAQTYDGSTLRLYINGTLDGSLLINEPLVSKDVVLTLGNNPESHPLDGWLDEIRVWSIARTRADLLASMGRRLTGNEFGLAGYWPLDEGEGNRIFDVSVNALHGSLGHSTSVESSDPTWIFSGAISGD
jgi:hypothetical protein